ncbi:MAG: hypothetical protein ACEPOZ_00330 [Marinifilaceae bacterium]
MKLLKKVQFSSVSRETTTGTTYKFSNGYGQITKAGAQVQAGATVTATVDIEMVIVTNERTQSWFDENKHIYTTEQQSAIEEHLRERNTASAWCAIFAWGATNSKDEDYFKNTHARQEETHTDQQKHVVNSASKLESKKVHVTGNIQITGVSMLPTEAFIYAEISTIQFEDGTTMQVINQSNPVAANSSGDTSAVDTKKGQHLTIVPIKEKAMV